MVAVISMRYHAISLAAVFLALALGVVLGASGVSDRLLHAVAVDRDDLAVQVQELTAENDRLTGAQRAADEFAARTGAATVRGSLTGQTVVLVTLGADAADRDAVVELAKAAGATYTGEVGLTDAVADPARAAQLRELTASLLPTGAQLPAATDTGSLAGGLLGGVLLAPGGRPQATPDQATAVLSGLATAGFVRPGPAPAPSNLVLVLTGGALAGLDAAESASVTARLAAQLDRAGGAVLAGRTGSAEATGAVGVARADTGIATAVSTVDDVDSGPGRVSAVLALREQLDGRAGRYGTAASAQDGATPAV
ncbi:copper transporter [Pseudonocardia sp.]|uniref:copper transporter n=1 Tax=Pseudonocardia sp. TaxID=60912 RepID=UPI003D0EE5D3